MLIDDNFDVCKEIKYSLKNETTDVYYALSANEGFEMLTKQNFCLVIMDIFLSGTNGFELIREIRKLKPIPILVLSSNADCTYQIEALCSGANGYLEKPYNLQVCIAQARSLIDLYTNLYTSDSQLYTLAFGTDLIIDPVRRLAKSHGKQLNLTRKEFDLLFCLASHVDQVLSREQLYNFVWNADVPCNVDELVKAHIKALRRKMAPVGKEYIKNEWGIGYRFSIKDD